MEIIGPWFVLCVGLSHALPFGSSNSLVPKADDTDSAESLKQYQTDRNSALSTDLPLESPLTPKAKDAIKVPNWNFLLGSKMSRRSADQFHLREESPLTCLVDENCIKIDARLRCNQSQVPLVASVASQGVPGECVCLSGLDWNAETNSCQSSRFWFNMGLLVMGVILLLMLFGLIAYFVLRVHE